MAAALNHLIISDLDFYRYTGWKTKRLKRLIEWSEIYGRRAHPILSFFIYPVLFAGKWIISSIAFGTILAILSGLLILALEFPLYSDIWPIAIAISICLGIIFGLIKQTKYFLRMTREEQEMESLIYLMEEVKKYNELLQDLRVKIRIAEIRKDLDKGSLIPLEQIFAAMQNQLVQALQIERLVRENRSIVKSGLNVLMEDAAFLRSVEIFSEIQEFDPILSLVLDIESNVRQEISRITPF